MSRAFVVLTALIYAGLGVGFLLLPGPMSSGIDLAPKTATALTDIRATYGGFEIGVAGLLLIFAVMRDWIVPGLLTVMLTVGGFAAGRVFGLAVDGVDGVLHPALLALEVTLITFAVVLLRRERRRTGDDVQPSRFAGRAPAPSAS